MPNKMRDPAAWKSTKCHLYTESLLISCGILEIKTPKKQQTGWWFQPLWKILVSWDYYSNIWTKKQKKTCSNKRRHKSNTQTHHLEISWAIPGHSRGHVLPAWCHRLESRPSGLLPATGLRARHPAQRGASCAVACQKEAVKLCNSHASGSLKDLIVIGAE